MSQSKTQCHDLVPAEKSTEDKQQRNLVARPPQCKPDAVTHSWRPALRFQQSRRSSLLPSVALHTPESFESHVAGLILVPRKRNRHFQPLRMLNTESGRDVG